MPVIRDLLKYIHSTTHYQNRKRFDKAIAKIKRCNLCPILYSVTEKVTRYRCCTTVTYEDIFATSNVVANTNIISDYSVMAANNITDVTGR